MIFYYLFQNFFILILSLGDSSRYFKLSFDFKYRNRLELLISTLEIELSRLSSRVGTNRQDLS